MLEAKVIENHPDNIVVMYREDLESRLQASRDEANAALIGRRWGINDCLRRLNGMRRDAFINHILKPKRQELESIGAVLHWSSGGRGSGKYLFRATVMSQWLEDNLQQITDGGW